TNADSSDNRPFPVIVREQEFMFNFYWHELLRLTTGKVLGARLGVELFLSRLFGLLSGRPPTNTRPPACVIDRPQRSGWRHHSQDIFVTVPFSGAEITGALSNPLAEVADAPSRKLSSWVDDDRSSSRALGSENMGM